MKYTKLIGILSLVFIISSCGTTHVAINPDEMVGDSEIVFYRPSDSFGAMMSAHIYVNGIKIGRMGNNSVLLWKGQSGKVLLESGRSEKTIEIKSNEKKYIEVTPKKELWLIPIGILDAAYNFDEHNEAEAIKEFPKLKS